jgi:cell shape-determining protein MreC
MLEIQRKEIEALKKKIEELEKSSQLETLTKENESLKKMFDELIKSSDDLASYKVFTDARDRFKTWIVIFFVIFGVFGVTSVKNMGSNLRRDTL